MSIRGDFNSLVWLSNLVDRKRARIAALLRRLTGCDERGTGKPSVFGKFLDLMEQISEQRAEEEQLLIQIDEIEEKHRQLRARSALERANPDLDDEDDYRPHKRLRHFFDLIFKIKSSDLGHENQGLTPD